MQRDAGGGYQLSFIGDPGQQYTVQQVDFLPATSTQWNLLSFRTADANGNFSITVPAPAAACHSASTGRSFRRVRRTAIASRRKGRRSTPGYTSSNR